MFLGGYIYLFVNIAVVYSNGVMILDIIQKEITEQVTLNSSVRVIEDVPGSITFLRGSQIEKKGRALRMIS